MQKRIVITLVTLILAVVAVVWWGRAPREIPIPSPDTQIANNDTQPEPTLAAPMPAESAVRAVPAPSIADSSPGSPMDTNDDTGNIAGVVVDAAGRKQRAMVVLDIASEPNAPKSVQTNEEGGFQFENLAAGTYELHLGPFGSSMVRRIVHAQSVTLAPGQSRRDLRLVYDESSMLRIAGRVVGSGDKSLAGVTVSAIAPAGMNSDGCMTDENGQFTLFNLSEGAYDINVFHPVHGRTTLQQIAVNTTDLVVRLEPAATFGTRVSGSVLEQGTRKPVTNFEVALVPQGDVMDGRAIDERKFARVADEHGRFEVTATPRKSVPLAIAVRAKGYSPAQAPIGAIDTLDPVAGIEIALVPGECAIEGVVRDSSGKGVGGAQVFVGTPREIARPAPAAGMPTRRGALQKPAAVTNADGAFSISGLGPGEISLSLHADGFAPTTHAVTLILNETSKTEITLVAPGSLSGLIRWNGEPVGGAQVFIGQSPSLFTEADVDGNYAFDGLPEGSVKIRAVVVRNEEKVAEGQIEALIVSGEVTEANIDVTDFTEPVDDDSAVEE